MIMQIAETKKNEKENGSVGKIQPKRLKGKNIHFTTHFGIDSAHYGRHKMRTVFFKCSKS